MVTPDGTSLMTDSTTHRQIEDRLRRSHDTFYQLIKRNPFGIYVVNADFVLTEISAGAEKVFATVQPTALGRDFAEVLREIWCEPFATEAIDRFRHTLTSGEPYVAAGTVERRADIDMIEAYDWRIERISLPDGRMGVVCYFYDLTERQQWDSALRASEERLRLATDAAGLGIWTWQPAADIVKWENDRPYEILNWPSTEAPISAARFAAEFVHPDDLPAFRTAMAITVEAHGAFFFEGRARRPDGVWIWLELTGKPIVGDSTQPLRVIGTIQDITKRKTAEDILKDSDRRKDEFLATLAHELRNPLAPIRNSLELMKRPGVNSELIAQARATMDRQVGQMVRLIDDLLDVSRINSNKLELKRSRVDLAHVVHQAVEACQSQFDRVGHELTVSLPHGSIILDADAARLAQVFGNLLNNACKYTKPGGHISLVALVEGRNVVISCRDNGVGIPAEMLPKVFDLFTQVDRSLERSEGGLGIGLSLVKRIVEMHGGTVSVYSSGPDQGTEVEVRLPTVTGEMLGDPLASNTTAGQVADSSFVPRLRRRLLIVDDNKDAATTLAMLLGMTGNETASAHDGIEAIQKAKEFKPDVVLLDIGLPKKNGYEVCREIRSHAWGKHIKMVAITGWGQEEDRRKSKEAGFDVHLVKPVEHSQLLALLETPCT